MNGELNQFTLELLEAKRREAEAKDVRVAIEMKIAALVETGANQSKTVDAGNGFKVTVKRALAYDANIDQIRELDLPVDQLPIRLIPSSYAFDPKAYEKIIQGNERAQALLADCIKTTPRKVAVTIKAC